MNSLFNLLKIKRYNHKYGISELRILINQSFTALVNYKGERRINQPNPSIDTFAQKEIVISILVELISKKVRYKRIYRSSLYIKFHIIVTYNNTYDIMIPLYNSKLWLKRKYQYCLLHIVNS